MRDEWRCVLLRGGELYMMMSGLLLMLKLCAGNLATTQSVYDCACYERRIVILFHMVLTSITGVRNYSNTHFGEGDGPAVLYNVVCSGSESRLLDCSYGTYISGVTDTEDAGVRCLLRQ